MSFREARLRPVCVNRLAPSDADNTALRQRSREVGCNDIDVMAELARLARKKVHVLADPAEVRIVVFRHDRYAQRALRAEQGCRAQRARPE